MYLTIKFVADGMMEPRILAVCNLSIKTDEPEIVQRILLAMPLTCWRSCRIKSCSSIRRLR